MEVTLQANGKLALKARDSNATLDHAPLITDHPGDQLSIGSDTGSPVGDYEGSNTLQGGVSQVVVKVLEGN